MPFDGLNTKARGANEIGPWLSLSYRIMGTKARTLQTAGKFNAIDPKAIASPQEIRDAQAALQAEADRVLGVHFLSGFAIVVMTDMSPPVVQMNVRYQGFDGVAAARPISAQLVAQLGGGKTRAIDLE